MQKVIVERGCISLTEDTALTKKNGIALRQKIEPNQLECAPKTAGSCYSTKACYLEKDKNKFQL